MYTSKSLATNENNTFSDTFLITLITRMLPSKSLITYMFLKYEATNVPETKYRYLFKM